MKESYEVVGQILTLIKYKDFNWHLAGDLKMIGIVNGLQAGYVKYGCFFYVYGTAKTVKNITPKTAGLNEMKS